MDQARIVIVGGGAVGTGIAYQLAQAGITDVLLLEREPALCSVTSPQAAGLVGQVRSSLERTRLARGRSRPSRGWSRKPRSSRAGGNGQPADRADARTCGGIRRMMAVAAEAGLETELLAAKAAQQLWPGHQPPSRHGDPLVPDRWLSPAGRSGGRLPARCPRQGCAFQDRGLRDRHNPQGRAGCGRTDGPGRDRLRDCRQCRRRLRVSRRQPCRARSPGRPGRHHYVITTPTDWIRPEMPVLRVPNAGLYARADVSALLGGWEAEALSVDPRDYALDGRPPPIEEDWPVLAGFMEAFRPFGGAARRPARSPGLHRLAHLHARRPLHRRPEPACARARLRGGLQCARRLGLGRNRLPRGRGHARPRPVTLRAQPVAGQVHRHGRRLAGCPPSGAARARDLLPYRTLRPEA